MHVSFGGFRFLLVADCGRITLLTISGRVTVVVLSVCLFVCLSVHILFSDYRL